jgi:hypothetical protein
MHESRGETTKNESLADDNTTLLELTENNLYTLRESLEKFGDISGLRCNYDKTLVVPIGTNTVIPNNLHGFTVSNKIKLLGLEISNDLNLLTENFLVIRDKIVSLVLFWERFKLTLPGRIAIIKTLLLPQLSYLGSFLTPDDEILSSIQKILDDFALNGQTMSRDRRYLNPEHGGGRTN